MEKELIFTKPYMQKVNEIIDLECKNAHSPLLKTLLAHTFTVRGKQFRPLLCLCAGNLKNEVKPTPKSLDSLYTVAAGLEILHTASLVHDDIIDEASLRRGIATVNSKWGIAPATLLGDWLLAKACELITRSENLQVIQGITILTAELSEGQFLEMEANSWKQYNTEDYFRMIDLKTSSIFRSACHFGSLLNPDMNQQDGATLCRFGTLFGLLFQVVDDLIDLFGNSVEFHKNTGIDLQNGLKTLPVLYAIEVEKLRKDKPLCDAIAKNDLFYFQNKLKTRLEELGSIAKCKKLIESYRQELTQILDNFPETSWRTLMKTMVETTALQI